MYHGGMALGAEVRRLLRRAKNVPAWARAKVFPPSPGLLMRYTPASPPGEVAVPEPYTVRPWREGDDAGWIALFNASGEFEKWTEERLRREMRGLVREAQYFACHGDEIVAATGVLDRKLEGERAWEIAWVVRHPAHTGARLGAAVLAAATAAAVGLPERRPVFLYTDDHRLTAIELYLELGYEADLEAHAEYRERWAQVRERLAHRAANEGGQRP